MVGRLEHLDRVVVRLGPHWRSCGTPQQTSLTECPVFRTCRSQTAAGIESMRGRGALLPIGCHRRHPPIGWVHDQRGARAHASPVPPDACIIGQLDLFTPVASFLEELLVFHRLLGREHRPPREL